jgi:rSAM/selenodomain-associated transferase 1
MIPGIIIFIKNPQLGRVKTRLAATVGDARALRIYQALMTHTRQVAEAVEAHRLLLYSDFVDEADEWSAALFQKGLQHPGDLGQRMAAAFEVAFEAAAPVVIIGSDCAQLTPTIVRDAIVALANNDVVIGPAEDGGYYMLGMRTPTSFLFEGIDWSTEHVLAQTLAILDAHSLRYAFAPTLSDIDFEEDWEKHGWPID